MKNNFLRLILLLFTTAMFAQVDKVSVVSNDEGMKLVVNGKDFMINGMNKREISVLTIIVKFKQNHQG